MTFKDRVDQLELMFGKPDLKAAGEIIDAAKQPVLLGEDADA